MKVEKHMLPADIQQAMGDREMEDIENVSMECDYIRWFDKSHPLNTEITITFKDGSETKIYRP